MKQDQNVTPQKDQVNNPINPSKEVAPNKGQAEEIAVKTPAVSRDATIGRDANLQTDKDLNRKH